MAQYSPTLRHFTSTDNFLATNIHCVTKRDPDIFDYNFGKD